jgi:hypothetical protein
MVIIEAIEAGFRIETLFDMVRETLYMFTAGVS